MEVYSELSKIPSIQNDTSMRNNTTLCELQFTDSAALEWQRIMAITELKSLETHAFQ